MAQWHPLLKAGPLCTGYALFPAEYSLGQQKSMEQGLWSVSVTAELTLYVWLTAQTPFLSLPMEPKAVWQEETQSH